MSQGNLASVKAQVTSLEVAIKMLQENVARLERDLDAANSIIADLNLALQAKHEHSEGLYKHLRVEHHAYQHGDKQKQGLSETIALKEVTETQLQEWKELEKADAITEKGMKQIELSNSILQAELFSNVQNFANELALSWQSLSLSRAALKGSN